ncbi:MAG TPA: MarR family transcriptional regulator [Actinospica sp.]|nr:MarR family transcriptional regulator [Actinospica sp.]
MTTAKPRRDLVHLLSRAEQLAARRLSAALEAEAAGASIEQWRVLNLLADGRGHTMTELAEHALLPAPTATKLADRLVADNLVYRHPDPADRRRVLVHLTDRGHDLHTRLAAVLDRMQGDLLDTLGAESGLEVLLGRLAEALDHPAPRSDRVAP